MPKQVRSDKVTLLLVEVSIVRYNNDNMVKKWKVFNPISTDDQAQFPEIDPRLLQLLFNRGIKTQAAIDEFLNPDWVEDIHDPYKFKDMLLAVKSIYQVITSGEPITVYADYDADGVTGGTVLVSCLKKLGAKVNIYIPHREREGYGLNEAAVRFIASQGVKLIITCDCGVANVEEVQLTNSLGVKVIITDHHQPKETLPAAAAIIHPSLDGESYPDKNLSGGAVAFKLVQGLIKNEQCSLSPKDKELLEKWMLDLVAISLVADIVPLLGEARTLTKYGLVVLQKNRRLGLQKLLTLAGIKPESITTNTIGWQIAPRINAAGRMDHANTGYALLAAEKENEADELAQALNSANSARQQMTDEIMNEAREQIGDKVGFLVTAFKPDWSAGLVGLVASKLVQIYNRPALVMTVDGNQVVGSGRSLPMFDLIQALAASGKYLLKFGGHKQAVGFRLNKEDMPEFLKHLSAYAKKELTNIDLTPQLDIDLAVAWNQINWQLLDQIKLLEPLGQNNPVPLFAVNEVRVNEMTLVGSQGQHRRLVLSKEGEDKKFILFNLADDKQIKINDIINVVFEVGVNEWNGHRELQLKIIDFKLHE